MTTRTCDCGKPNPTHHRPTICPDCVQQLRHLLGDLPALVDDVNLTITRQTAGGDRNGPRSSGDTVIAWDDRASTALAGLMVTLVSWARALVPVLEMRRDVHLDARAQLLRQLDDDAEDQHRQATLRTALIPLNNNIDQLTEILEHLTGPRWVITASHNRLIAILDTWLDDLTARDDATALLHDLDRRSRALTAVTDTPAPRLYLGPCRADPLKAGVPCEEELYAVDHRDRGDGHLCTACRSLRCRVCGTEHDVAQRRAWLREAIDDRLAPAIDIARGLATTTGYTATEDQIRWWLRSGRLSTHGNDKAGRALFRVGDVIDLARADAARALERAAKKSRHAGRPESA